MAGSTSRFSVATSSGSVAVSRLRPPPGRRVRSDSLGALSDFRQPFAHGRGGHSRCTGDQADPATAPRLRLGAQQHPPLPLVQHGQHDLELARQRLFGDCHSGSLTDPIFQPCYLCPGPTEPHACTLQLRLGHGIRVGRKRVARLMRHAGLAGVQPRSTRPVTTVRDCAARPAPDLVERGFTATAPNQLWAADITYLPTAAGFLSLAVVLDACSRRVIGWSMQPHTCASRSSWPPWTRPCAGSARRGV